MPIPHLSYVLLFVENPLESSRFYSRLLQIEPKDTFPTFVSFALPNGVMLGLWSRHTARPQVTSQAGGSEIAFEERDVDSIYEKWVALGVKIALEPVAMDGMSRTFVALDPDGHRLRIFCLEEKVSHG
jgi:predicted enzyme related to lactoylglutathione lyase